MSKVFIITGASRGIGRAAAIEAITKFDARVVAVARSSAALEQLQNDVSKLNKSDHLEVVVGDVTDEQVVRKTVNVAIDRWGQLDSVIANAGVIEPIATIAESPVEGWKKLFDINVFSIVSLIQHALPHIRKSEQGSIISVSSGAALKGYHGWGAYGSTLAAEEPNVTAIAIRPGVVDTEMQTMIRSSGAEGMKDDHAKFIELHREGKLVKPEDPAHVLVALANQPPKHLSGGFYSWNDEPMKPFNRTQ
ncbi:putative oxidoreductase C30D10.05c [Choanephora cucurbitarum]|uniref:Putative oxidoreductase C30D10.05c n=1 Tax=Choanephora cucurbitarum TaxID=101091 RepID=A0A1C7N409_9FUNG|nr:putative oxidoreductase C30D10.05c [Choanephora cucurbitarum]